MRKDEILGLAIILATVVAIMLVYSNLPAEITTNWDSNGQALGTMHKKLFVVGSLATIFAILAVFMIISRIPKYIPETRQTQIYYGIGLNLTLLFPIAVIFAIIASNSGVSCNVLKVSSVCISLIILFLGIVVRNAKSHWFVSLRTPWTKRNEQVWNKTHRLLGNMFCIIGICGAVAGTVTFYALFATNIVVLAVVFAFVYSHIKYRKMKLPNQGQGSKSHV